MLISLLGGRYDIEDDSAGRMLGTGLAGMASAETLTIATVNNGDMVRMQGLTSEFTAKKPGHHRRMGHARRKRPA